MSNYSRVLIIGNTFNTKTGGGITMSNLFKDWPKDRIAVATQNIEKSEVDICENYYKLGDDEYNVPLIFKLFKESKKSGVVESLPIEQQKFTINDFQISLLKNIINKMKITIRRTFVILGLDHFVYRMRVSNKLLKWVKNYNPEILYIQMTSYAAFRFSRELVEHIRIPYVLHFMDDHYISSVTRGFFKKFIKSKIQIEFREFIQNAHSCLSISDAMSEIYKNRFGREFISFHNPVCTDEWGKYMRTQWETKSPFTLLYAGRVGIAIEESLFDIAKCVEELGNEGLSIRFILQTNMSSRLDYKKYDKFIFTSISPCVAYSELPKILSNASLLVMPNDFSKTSIEYIKYSMPTKTAEYMITGTPILVYSPAETALSKYAKENGWAYVVDERNYDTLKSAIVTLYYDRSLRKHIGLIAQRLALNIHDAFKVREKFKATLSLKNSQVNEYSFYI